MRRKKTVNPPAKTLRRKIGIGCLVVVAMCALVGIAFWLRYRQAVSIGSDRALAAAENLSGISTPTSVCVPNRGEVPRGERELRLQSGGQSHRYLVYVPEKYDPTLPAPLVLSLHGTASSPQQQRDYSQWNVFAEELGVVVVYPAGGFSFQSGSNPAEVDQDLVYVQDLLAALEQMLCLDRDHYYVTGFSSGGSLAVLLACRLPGVFSAVGTVSAPIWQGQLAADACPEGNLPPLIAFHGTADWIVQYSGGQAPTSPEYLAFETWTAAWAEKLDCPAEHEIVQEAGGVSGRLWNDCLAGRRVHAYTIPGGGHNWPGGSPLLDLVLGNHSAPFLATKAMWEFFIQSEENGKQ